MFVQRRARIPEEAEGVPQLPGGEEGGGGWNRLLKDVCVCRGVTGYLKKLKEFLNSPAGKKAEEEDVKIKQIALRSTENLQVTS